MISRVYSFVLFVFQAFPYWWWSQPSRGGW